MTYPERYRTQLLAMTKDYGEWLSHCFSRKVGAMVVTPDGTIVATGYNGPPRGVPHCNAPVRLEQITKLYNFHYKKDGPYLFNDYDGLVCPRQYLGFKSGEALFLCQAGHAERNCIVNAAREGISVKGCILFVSSIGLPCAPCAVEIINAGIVQVYNFNGPDYDKDARYLFEQVSVKIQNNIIIEGK